MSTRRKLNRGHIDAPWITDDGFFDPKKFISPFNEPEDAYTKIPFSKVIEFIGECMDPQFARAGLTTKLQTSNSHRRSSGLRNFPDFMKHPKTSQYIKGFAVHSYDWQIEGSSGLTSLHERYPDIPIWQTEVCYFEIGP